jgi:integration host factor subunit beta
LVFFANVVPFGYGVIRSQLVLIVAGQLRHIRQRDVDQAVDTILDQIASSLAIGDRVELRGFGSFAVRMRESRVGRNPRTGEKIHVSGKKALLFRQSADIRKRLNVVAPIAEARGRASSA